MTLPNIATVIGSGTMGPGIAATLAQAGVTVRVYDISEAALEQAKTNTTRAADVLTELNGPHDSTPAVSFGTNLAEALADTELVIEAVPEKLELKTQVLAQIEELVDDQVPIATNTSGIPISRMAASMKVPSRFIGMHWSNPPHLIPLIEVIPGEATAQSVVDELVAAVKAFNYNAVVQKEKAGFVENRVLYAILRECLALLEEGIVSPEGLDTTVKWGIGYKLSVIGPTRLLDMAGLDIYQAVSAYLNQDLDASTTTPQLVEDMVAQNKLGFKTGAGMYEYTPAEIEAKRADIIAGLTEVRKTLSAITSI